MLFRSGAWQSGAISRETMFDLFRKGEVLPTGRTDDEEKKLVRAGLANIQIGREIPAGVSGKAGNTPVAGAIPGTSNVQHSTPNNQP